MKPRVEGPVMTGSGGHPDELVTAAYLEGTLTEEHRDAVESHLADCESCRSGIVLLARQDRAGTERVPPEWIERARGAAAPVRAPGARTRPVLISALAAAVVLLALGGALYMRNATPPTPSSPLERAGRESGLRALAPPNGAVLPAADLVFIWSPLPGADRYVVTVTDAGGRIVGSFESDSPGEPAAWPAQRPPLAPGAYLWSVRAMALDRVVAETRPTPFELR